LCGRTGGKVASGENRPRKKTKDGSAKWRNPNGQQPRKGFQGERLECAEANFQDSAVGKEKAWQLLAIYAKLDRLMLSGGATMTTLNISLPDQMRAFIDSQVNRGLYSTASDYIRDLIRDDQKRRDQEKLETLLLDALEEGGSQEVTPEFFERLRVRARQAIKTKESGTP
jgi:antitoxin ParD1/3/4